jgi:fermentation-respiration switch protein FrsA (DUF1100 family)
MSKQTVVFLHENAGNIGLRMDYFSRMVGVVDVNILTVAYRGYSSSEGYPDEAGLKQDGLDIMRYVRDNKDTLVEGDGDFYLLGRSLGGAVAAYVATHPDTPYDLFRGLVLESTFTSISDMVDVMFFPPITTFKSSVLRIDWTTASLVPTLTIPTLYVSGDADELVPHKHTLQLHKLTTRAPMNELFVVKNGMHNDTWQVGGERYLRKLKSFFNAASKEPVIPRAGQVSIEQAEEAKSDL